MSRKSSLAAVRFPEPDGESIRIGATSEEQWIPLSKLVIPREGELGYQRQFSPAWAKRIAAEFDESLWTKPMVALRLGGQQFAVIDGQHRVEALRLKYPGDDPEILCDVQSTPSIEAEARQFLAVNHYVRVTGSRDSFKALLVAGDERAHNIDRLLRAYGYTPKTEGGKQRDGQISVSAVQILMRQHGFDDWWLLEETLRVVRDSFGDHTAALGSTVFGGIGSFIATYRQHPDYERRRLVDVLHRVALHELTRNARDLRKLLHTSDSVAARRSILHIYNNKLSKRRLPEV